MVADSRGGERDLHFALWSILPLRAAVLGPGCCCDCERGDKDRRTERPELQQVANIDEIGLTVSKQTRRGKIAYETGGRVLATSTSRGLNKMGILVAASRAVCKERNKSRTPSFRVGSAQSLALGSK